jgi:hypothetical protein
MAQAKYEPAFNKSKPDIRNYLSDIHEKYKNTGGVGYHYGTIMQDINRYSKWIYDINTANDTYNEILEVCDFTNYVIDSRKDVINFKKRYTIQYLIYFPDDDTIIVNNDNILTVDDMPNGIIKCKTTEDFPAELKTLFTPIDLNTIKPPNYFKNLIDNATFIAARLLSISPDDNIVNIQSIYVCKLQNFNKNYKKSVNDILDSKLPNSDIFIERNKLLNQVSVVEEKAERKAERKADNIEEEKPKITNVQCIGPTYPIKNP